MKKCASCTKDLPDAALHCVFCGAKQPPAPAAQPGMAKTVMGYGNNEELNKLREQAAATNAARSNSPSAPPVAPSMPAPAPAYNAPRPHTPSAPPPAGYAPGNLAPVAGAQARTMFVDGPPPGGGPRPNSPSSQPMGNPMGPGPSMGGPSGGYNPQPAGGYNPPPAYNPQPAAPAYNPQPIPTAPAPYMAPGHNANQAARPIEPWKDTLRLMMFIWGGVLLACFATPLTTSPLVGMWDFVLNGEGTDKLLPLILAAVGILSIVVGAIPMASGPRGAIAAVLALSGIFVPMFIAGMPAWQMLASTAGVVLLVPGLLMRNEYTESPLPRILVTVGALASLAPFVVPDHGTVPVVGMFKALINTPGAAKIIIALIVLYVVLNVLTLLAWLPSPATAGAKIFAWALMLFPLVMHVAALFLIGDPSNVIDTPNTGILGWAYGGGTSTLGIMGGMNLGTAYLVISSYGLASVLGKNLE